MTLIDTDHIRAACERKLDEIDVAIAAFDESRAADPSIDWQLRARLESRRKTALALIRICDELDRFPAGEAPHAAE